MIGVPIHIRGWVIGLAALIVSACAAPEAPPPAPEGADIHLPTELRTVSDRIVRGATVASLLRAHEVAEAEIAAFVARTSAVFDLRRVRVNQPYRLAQALDGALRWFEYEIDGDRILKVTPADAGPGDFVAEVVPIAKTARAATVRGQIDEAASSLFAAMDREGETVGLTLGFAEVFSSDVDFNTELQPGDRFEVLVDKLYRDDDQQFSGYGPIRAAELQTDGRRLTAVRFTPEGGSPSYFDVEGRSLRRFFLRSPLRFEPVVTSAFTRRRLHPVLHVYRAHLGVDYRAPEGAPVQAVANGVVLSAGWSGGSGRMVHLRHANGFETQYLHLSSIAVRRGARVAQGDLIGRVGSTGLATGPHLDYRLKKNGVYLNPVTAHRQMPPGDPVPPSQLAAFQAVRDQVLAELATPADTRSADVGDAAGSAEPITPVESVSPSGPVDASGPPVVPSVGGLTTND
jgi:murein DD-endopeptidase MepM/ murein hydrolase activator NlpD